MGQMKKLKSQIFEEVCNGLMFALFLLVMGTICCFIAIKVEEMFVEVYQRFCP